MMPKIHYDGDKLRLKMKTSLNNHKPNMSMDSRGNWFYTISFNRYILYIDSFANQYQSMSKYLKSKKNHNISHSVMKHTSSEYSDIKKNNLQRYIE